MLPCNTNNDTTVLSTKEGDGSFLKISHMAGVSNGLLTRATNLSENEKIKAPKTLKTCKFLILIMAYVFISEFKLYSCFFGGEEILESLQQSHIFIFHS